MAVTIVSAILGGLAVGILSGLLGVGGGIIVIPLLRLLFGVDSLVATGTSLFVILPTSVAGVIGRIRSKTLHVGLSLIIGLGGVLFSPIGSWLASFAGGSASMYAAAIVIAYTGANMVRKTLAKAKPNAAAGAVSPKAESVDAASVEPASAERAAAKPDASMAASVSSAQGESDATGASSTSVPIAAVAGSAPAAVPQAEGGKISNGFELNPRCVIAAILVGAVAGFLSGFIGVGGGFIIIPMVIWLFGMPFKHATGVSLLALCILSVPGIITHGLYGHIDFLKGAMLAIGSIPGSLLGSALLKRIPEKGLKIAFGILLVVVAVILAINELNS